VGVGAAALDADGGAASDRRLGPAFLYGYAAAWAGRAPKVEDEAFRRFARAELRRRVRRELGRRLRA
jgi:hypothetical protein